MALGAMEMAKGRETLNSRPSLPPTGSLCKDPETHLSVSNESARQAQINLMETVPLQTENQQCHRVRCSRPSTASAGLGEAGGQTGSSSPQQERTRPSPGTGHGPSDASALSPSPRLSVSTGQGRTLVGMFPSPQQLVQRHR